MFTKLRSAFAACFTFFVHIIHDDCDDVELCEELRKYQTKRDAALSNAWMH